MLKMISNTPWTAHDEEKAPMNKWHSFAESARTKIEAPKLANFPATWLNSFWHYLQLRNNSFTIRWNQRWPEASHFKKNEEIKLYVDTNCTIRRIFAVEMSITIFKLICDGFRDFSSQPVLRQFTNRFLKQFCVFLIYLALYLQVFPFAPLLSKDQLSHFLGKPVGNCIGCPPMITIRSSRSRQAKKIININIGRP
jgi:hypothetical protein